MSNRWHLGVVGKESNSIFEQQTKKENKIYSKEKLCGLRGRPTQNLLLHIGKNVGVQRTAIRIQQILVRVVRTVVSHTTR